MLVFFRAPHTRPLSYFMLVRWQGVVRPHASGLGGEAGNPTLRTLEAAGTLSLSLSVSLYLSLDVVL